MALAHNVRRRRRLADAPRARLAGCAGRLRRAATRCPPMPAAVPLHGRAPQEGCTPYMRTLQVDTGAWGTHQDLEANIVGGWNRCAALGRAPARGAARMRLWPCGCMPLAAHSIATATCPARKRACMLSSCRCRFTDDAAGLCTARRAPSRTSQQRGPRCTAISQTERWALLCKHRAPVHASFAALPAGLEPGGWGAPSGLQPCPLQDCEWSMLAMSSPPAWLSCARLAAEAHPHPGCAAAAGAWHARCGDDWRLWQRWRGRDRRQLECAVLPAALPAVQPCCRCRACRSGASHPLRVAAGMPSR